MQEKMSPQAPNTGSIWLSRVALQLESSINHRLIANDFTNYLVDAASNNDTRKQYSLDPRSVPALLADNNPQS